MWPVIGGIAASLGSLASGWFSSETSAQNTQQQIQASQQMQQTQNAFTERMSNTAYQRASQDMQKAGLNPAMMFGSGSAASTPQASNAQAPMPQKTSPFAGVGDAVGKMVNSAISVKTMDKMTEEIANLQAEQANIKARTATEEKKPQLVSEETHKTATEIARLQNLMPGFRLSGKEAEAVLNMPAWMRDKLVQGAYGAKKVGEIGGAAGDILSSAIGAKRLFRGNRTTTERSSTGPSGDTSSFEERFHY